MCSKCKKEKTIDDFYKCKNSLDGYNSWCKECINNYKEQWNKDNSEKVREYGKKHSRNNKEKLKLYYKKWRDNNPDKLKKNVRSKIEQKKYYNDNIERIKKVKRKWRLKNKEKYNEWRENNKEKIRKYGRENRKKYYKKPNIRINHNMSCAINRSLKNGKERKHWEDLIGYTHQDLKKHLEVQFKEGMTWENYGKDGWVIDHKIPISLFNITSVKSKGFKKCWALENLQPMWEKDNLEKSNKLFF